MKKLLIVSQTYYPDSRATISILHRIAAGTAQTGVEVLVLPLENLSDGRIYPPEFEGVKILPMPQLAKKPVRLKALIALQKAVQKLLYAEKHLYTKADPEKTSLWNKCIDQLRRFQRAHWLTPLSERIRDLTLGLTIKAVIEDSGVDCLASVSLPFWVHRATRKALSFVKEGSISWVPVCFDPYAYTQNDESVNTRKRTKEELAVYAPAKQILMLSQSAADYAHSPLKEKIRYFEIPNLRNLSEYQAISGTYFAEDAINCLFIGNLYWEIRNPEFMLRMFERFSDDRIRLHIVGSLSYNFPKSYMEEWLQKCNGRLSYKTRVSTVEALRLLNAADVLVNIGNTTKNQCPSKVIEYISTGKPILQLSKIQGCTSQAYLKDYPLAFTVREDLPLENALVNEIEAFILSSKNKQIPYSEVCKLYSNCTNEHAVQVLLSSFQ